MSVHALESAPTARMFTDAPVGTLTNVELGDHLVGYAGQITALTARFLELLAEFDARGAWADPGVLSCVHWLTWRTGMDQRTAQEHLRVARALPGLTKLAAAFRAGQLTYSKIRALTRVATPEREPELLDLAASATASQLERVVRAMKQVDRNNNQDDNPEMEPVESTGRWTWNFDGTLSVTLRLAPLDGAAFLAGAVRAEYERTRTETDPDVPRNAPTDLETQPPRRARDLWRHVPSNIAPAVVVMADTVRTVVNIPAIAPAADVIIHTHAGLAGEGDPTPHLDRGPALSEADTCEAECGASRSTTVDAGGARLWWGRSRRTPNRRLVELILQRDHCCAHPGCGRTRHLHIHHVKYWSKGGTTDPDNLILLCSTHHRALHHSAFSITAHGKQRFTFHRPDGTLIDPAPPLGALGDWQPDRGVAPDATEPVSGGRLNLDYAIEVLYRGWEHREQHKTAA